MCDSDDLKTDDPIIDLGTGNGVMLRELDDFGQGVQRAKLQYLLTDNLLGHPSSSFTNLTGIDYSIKSIELARKVCSNVENLELQQQDIMEENKSFEGKFSIALDKGTFDAISLNPGRCF